MFCRINLETGNLTVNRTVGGREKVGVQIIKQVQNFMTKTLSSLKVAAKKLGVQLHTLHTHLRCIGFANDA